MPQEDRPFAAEDCRALIEWLLQGDPRDRPTMEQVLDHRFLKEGSLQPCSAKRPCQEQGRLEGPCGAEPGERCKVARKYRCFISHYQAEASGEAGNLWSHLKLLGIQAWRDVNQRNIVLEAMLQGVRDSDCVVVLLTNATLSRSYCLKELREAFKIRKPIYVVQEKESRFWPWDHRRSARDLLRWGEPSFPREATVDLRERHLREPLEGEDGPSLGWEQDHNVSRSWLAGHEPKNVRRDLNQ